MAQVTLPDALRGFLGDDAKREVLGGILLKPVLGGCTTFGRAAELLGFGYEEAVRWYNGYGLSCPDLDDEDLACELTFAGEYPRRTL